MSNTVWTAALNLFPGIRCSPLLPSAFLPTVVGVLLLGPVGAGSAGGSSLSFPLSLCGVYPSADKYALTQNERNYACVYVHICTYTPALIRSCSCTICICTCMYVCMYACMYMFTYICPLTCCLLTCVSVLLSRALCGCAGLRRSAKLWLDARLLLAVLGASQESVSFSACPG